MIIFFIFYIKTVLINIESDLVKIFDSSKAKIFQCQLGSTKFPTSAYLPGVGVNRDHEGGSPRVRPFHCTSARLTPTITPNVGNSNAQFLLVGDCVRAIPL